MAARQARRCLSCITLRCTKIDHGILSDFGGRRYSGHAGGSLVLHTARKSGSNINLDDIVSFERPRSVLVLLLFEGVQRESSR